MRFKAYVINLDTNPERLAYMTEQLEKAHIIFEREKAVLGKTYDFSNDFNEISYRKANKGAGISLGELGCALSHKHAVQRMLDEGVEYALIMEDDINIPPYFKKILDKEIARQSSIGWEYLSFNYPSVGHKAIILWLFLFYNMFTEKKGIAKYFTLPVYFLKFIAVSTLSLFEGLREWFYKKIYTLGKPALFLRPLYLAGCYLITRTGAEKLLKTQGETILYTADRLPNVARVQHGLQFYGYVPLQIIQQRDKFQSNSVDPKFDEKVKKFMGGRLLRE